MSSSTVKLLSKTGEHGTHAFYKSFQFLSKSKWRTVQLGRFFFVKIGKDRPICIGELQLVWTTKNISGPLCSVKLYFLPEQMPAGREAHHGEDEVVATEKMVLNVKDLIKWIIYEGVDWSLGRSLAHHKLQLSKACNCTHTANKDGLACNVVIVNFDTYCRIRAMLRRLQGCSDDQLKQIISLPCFLPLLGLPDLLPNTYVLFCRETVDHPELESHDFRCDHLAPSLKGRPRKNKFAPPLRSKRSSRTDEDGTTQKPVKTEKRAEKKLEKKTEKKADKDLVLMKRGKGRPRKDMQHKHVLASKDNFNKALYKFMKDQSTPITRVPSLGFKKLDLFTFFKRAHDIGGYHEICQKRLWKHLYDQLGGNQNNTSAATCTKRHYERLLLSFENHLRRVNGLPIRMPKKNSGFSSTLTSSKTSEKPSTSTSSQEVVQKETSQVDSKRRGSQPDNTDTTDPPRKLTRSVMTRRQLSANALLNQQTLDSKLPDKKETTATTTITPDTPTTSTATNCESASGHVTSTSVSIAMSVAALPPSVVSNIVSTTVAAQSTWAVPVQPAPPAPTDITKVESTVAGSATLTSADQANSTWDSTATGASTTASAETTDNDVTFIKQMIIPSHAPQPAHLVSKCDMPLNILGPCHPGELTDAQRSPWSVRMHRIITDPDLIPDRSIPNCSISSLKRKVPDGRDQNCVLNLSKKVKLDYIPLTAHALNENCSPAPQQCGAIDLSVRRKVEPESPQNPDQPIAYIKKEFTTAIDLSAKAAGSSPRIDFMSRDSKRNSSSPQRARMSAGRDAMSYSINQAIGVPRLHHPPNQQRILPMPRQPPPVQHKPIHLQQKSLPMQVPHQIHPPQTQQKQQQSPSQQQQQQQQQRHMQQMSHLHQQQMHQQHLQQQQQQFMRSSASNNNIIYSARPPLLYRTGRSMPSHTATSSSQQEPQTSPRMYTSPPRMRLPPNNPISGLPLYNQQPRLQTAPNRHAILPMIKGYPTPRY